MASLNHSVITGKCLGCVAYQEKVARLEGEHERDTRALQSVWDDFHIVEQKRDEARAANAALTAALKAIGNNLDGDVINKGNWSKQVNLCHDIVDAALSDAGEGRLPPVQAERLAQLFHEKYEHYARKLGYETRRESSGQWEQVPALNKRLMIATCSAVLATLDALGGK